VTRPPAGRYAGGYPPRVSGTVHPTEAEAEPELYDYCGRPARCGFTRIRSAASA